MWCMNSIIHLLPYQKVFYPSSEGSILYSKLNEKFYMYSTLTYSIVLSKHHYLKSHSFEFIQVNENKQRSIYDWEICGWN